MSLILAAIKQVIIFIFTSGDEFAWIPGETPLSDWKWPVGGALAYLAAVTSLSSLVKKRLRVPTYVYSIHNIILCFGSAAMFMGCLSAVIKVRLHCFGAFL
jgi:hypothetical protein